MRNTRLHIRIGEIGIRVPLIWPSLLAAVLLAVAPVSAAQAERWVPPIGIPVPPFGISEVAPQPPSPWNAPRAGFYFVCESCPGATDSANAYGTPVRPRVTIPNQLPAGSVVELSGRYTRRHTSPNGLVLNGTATAPVFIRGANRSSQPTILASWEVSGTYAILEKLAFRLPGHREGLHIVTPSSHLSLRYNDISGNPNGGGVGIGGWTTASASHIVVHANRIHDNGDVNASFDQDVHGIAVGARVSNLWIVDNELSRNSGDGLQLNGGPVNQSTLHHVYIGRNVAHGNKQTGFWVKQALDVIISQNVSYGHRASNSSSGDGMGGQYAPGWLWFLFNDIYDNESGIRIASDNGLGTGRDIFIVGNRIHRIHKVTGKYNSNTAYEVSAVGIWGGTNVHVVNNTIWDVDAGISSPRTNGKLSIFNNIIDTPSQTGASQVFLENASLAGSSTMDYNLFLEPSRIRWGDYTQRSHDDFHAATGKGGHSMKTQDPRFSDAAARDFRILAESPAVDRGLDVDSINEHHVYAAFASRYQLDIRKDAAGAARPQGSGFDIGAYEYAGGSERNGRSVAR